MTKNVRKKNLEIHLLIHSEHIDISSLVVHEYSLVASATDIN